MASAKAFRYFIKLNLINTVAFFVYLVLKIKRIFLKGRNGIRVLVYHSICAMPPGGDRIRISVPPALFEQQIKYLRKAGYRIISLDELRGFIAGESKPSGKEIAITFDDGFKDNYAYAFSALKKYGICAAFFLAAAFIGGEGFFPWYRVDAAWAKPMGWQEILDMADAGMAIGSHTLSHQNLGELPFGDNGLLREISGSKKMIEEKTGKKVCYFAYPFGCHGSYSPKTEEILRRQGYLAAFTNIYGINHPGDNIFALKRCRVDWNDTQFKFKMKLAGAYDWVDRLKSQAGDERV